MSAHNNEAAIRRFYAEVMTKGNVSVMDELTAPDFKEHEPIPGFEPNREGLKAAIAQFLAAFPDMQVLVSDVISQGDQVVVRGTLHGTRQGTSMGIPATGEKFQMELIDIVRFENGKAAEHWGVSDNLGMLTQLGVVPPPGAPPGQSGRRSEHRPIVK